MNSANLRIVTFLFFHIFSTSISNSKYCGRVLRAWQTLLRWCVAFFYIIFGLKDLSYLFNYQSTQIRSTVAEFLGRSEPFFNDAVFLYVIFGLWLSQLFIYLFIYRHKFKVLWQSFEGLANPPLEMLFFTYIIIGLWITRFIIISKDSE